MLTDSARKAIESSIDALASRLDQITPAFYGRMFRAHPELLDGLFSRASQRSGEQSRALTASIVGFARAVLAGMTADAIVERIAHKHTSLGVAADQYAIVYKHLFAAIADDLGDAATPEIVEAWSELYWLFADTLIALEQDLCRTQLNDQSWAPWRLVGRKRRTPEVVELMLEPSSAVPVTPGRAGEFVSVRVPVVGGIRQTRQFSLLEPGKRRRIAVKLDERGEVSPVLHRLAVGEIVDLSNPYGVITLDDANGPVVFASAGIGCTPTVAFLSALVERGSERETVVIHADRNRKRWAFAEQITENVAKLPFARLRSRFDEEGDRLVLEQEDLSDGATLYLCGPLGFMMDIRTQALALGVPRERIHYEVFGPDSWSPERRAGDPVASSPFRHQSSPA